MTTDEGGITSKLTNSARSRCVFLRPTHIQQMIFIWRGKLKAVLPKVRIAIGSHGYVNGSVSQISANNTLLVTFSPVEVAQYYGLTRVLATLIFCHAANNGSYWLNTVTWWEVVFYVKMKNQLRSHNWMPLPIGYNVLLPWIQTWLS